MSKLADNEDLGERIYKRFGNMGSLTRGDVDALLEIIDDHKAGDPHRHDFQPVAEVRYGNLPTILVCSCTAWRGG